jgi:hypothetical protein
MKKDKVAIVFAVIALCLGVLSFSRSVKSVSAAPGDVPTGIVKGVQLETVFHGAAGTVLDAYEVEEVRGPWVRVKVVRSQIWSIGYAGLWLNLDAIDQVSVEAPPAKP